MIFYKNKNIPSRIMAIMLQLSEKVGRMWYEISFTVVVGELQKVLGYAGYTSTKCKHRLN